MKLSSLIGHASYLASLIEKSRDPSDRLASQYFRSKKYIGSKERRFLSESVFFHLRILSLSRYLTDSCFDLLHNESAGKIEFITSLILAKQFNDHEMISFAPYELLLRAGNSGEFRVLVNECLSDILNTDSTLDQYSMILTGYNKLAKNISSVSNCPGNSNLKLLSDYFIMPEFLLMSLLTYLNIDQISAISKAMMDSAPAGIRIQGKSIDRNDLIKSLCLEENHYKSGSISPSCINIYKRIQIISSIPYKNGFIEIQDEGSQLIGFALNPAPKSRVLDACAGAGGKTMHIADLQNDSGHIVSADIDLKKLKELNKRAARAGFNSINTFLWQTNPGKKASSKQKEQYNKLFNRPFDYVLVDAPCSGSGTVRRSPMQKWRLNEKLIQKHSRKQFELLSKYSEYVRPGGILVYATCSILPQENNYVIDKFMDVHPDFEPSPLAGIFKENDIEIANLEKNQHFLTLLPGIHGTDGFFMARFKRTVCNI